MIYLRRVAGPSMLPTLVPGSIVIAVHPVRAVKAGRLVIVEHDGREKIKRLSRIRDGRIYLLGDNPTASTDSRHFGWLPVHAVKAVVVWPRYLR